jgi:hypothetical protein
MTTELFPKPKEGDVFTETTGARFTVSKLFEVQGDSWIEYYNSNEQPFYCRTEAFLQRFSITQSDR